MKKQPGCLPYLLIGLVIGLATIATAIALPTPAFSSLTPSESVPYGTASVTLTGLLSASGPVYPASGSTVTASINGHPVNGTVTDTTGDFLINYNDPSLATDSVSGSPYIITYSFAGDANVGAAANDTSTALTVSQGTPPAAETIGGGTLSSPAVGPAPSYAIGATGYTLIKNWHFGTNGTIPDIATMNANFQYHDQFGTIRNPNYGAEIVSPDSANALPGQPLEGANTGGAPVRTFFANYLQTYLAPLNGATLLKSASLNTGSGSFQAKWTLPNGGSLLGHGLIWETRVRYVTPPYFYFGLWTSGNLWGNSSGGVGAEMDLNESYGFDDTVLGGPTNYLGQLWHCDSVGGVDNVNYSAWNTGMAAAGITNFDATQYHTWDWVYNADNTYQAYMDGILIQSGTINWTDGGTSGGTPINMSFIFDGTWGSPDAWLNNDPVTTGDYPNGLPASDLTGKYYEWAYSRVYMQTLATMPPALGISTYNNQPVAFFPTATGKNFTLMMSTNLASGNWVPVTNGIPFSGLQITNGPSNAFFKLQ